MFHTYAVAHAKTSDEMAKRAETRLQDAKLAVTEAEAGQMKAAEQQATTIVAASNGGKKRSAGTAGGKAKAKKPAFAAQVAAARAAHAENTASAKAKPTKLDRDMTREIKLIKSAGPDKAQDYTVRRSVQRIEGLIEKDAASGDEAFVSQGGIETIMETVARRSRSSSYSDDLSYLAESAGNIFVAVVRADPNHFLKESRFPALWDDVEKKMKSQETNVWLDVITELLSIDVVCNEYLTPDRLEVIHEEFKSMHKSKRSYWGDPMQLPSFFEPFLSGLQNGNSFSAALLEKLSPDDLKCWNKDEFYDAEPLDGPTFSYFGFEDHHKITKFLRVVAESPKGLSLMKKADVVGIKEFVNAHEREYDFKSYGRIQHNHESCGEGCHADAKRVLELLG